MKLEVRKKNNITTPSARGLTFAGKERMDIKQVGAELLEILKQGLISGSKTVSEQFPILCQQILKWGLVNNICTILLSVFFMVISYKSIKYLCEKIKEKETDFIDNPFWFIGIIILGIVGITFLICFWCAIFELGKIISAPNVYLLDYFKDLITPKSS